MQIGTVVEGEGTGSAKKTYDGQDYDYVFDIDIEDGKPPLKLPYNLTESAWDAARKFLERNELPMTYYEQVANWIQDNTKGAKLGQASGSSSTPQQARDPWGSDNRYRPGDARSSSVSGQRKLPQRSYVEIIEGNPSNAINIILQKSEELRTSGTISADQALQPEEIEALKALSSQLQNKQDPRPTDVQTNALLKIASSWPTKSKVPAVGVLALLAVSPSFVSTTSSGSGTVVNILNQAGVLQPRQESANNVVHALRLLVNLFKTDAGRLIADGTYDAVLELVRPFVGEPESPAQLKALATLYLNYAVLLTSQAPANEASRREARAGVLLLDVLRLGEYEGPYASDGVIQFRSLAAVGTLLTLGADFRSQYNQKALGPSLYLESRKPTAQSPDIQALLAEINDELR